MKYTRKQILEAIKHWKKRLNEDFSVNADEDGTIHDDQVSDEMGVKLDIPGSNGVSIRLKGEWSAVRFAADMLTDALAHMKKADPEKYHDVSMHVEKDLAESFKISLADKQSATKALLDHNDELADFIDQDPHPTKDQLIDFVAGIFKEDGIDTPWTRQFLIKMKMYTHGFDDAVQYLYNARLKGQKLGMDQGLHENDAESKIQLGLRSDDYHGYYDENVDLDSIDEVTTEGLAWLKEQFKKWMDEANEVDPDAYDMLYAEEFESASDKKFLTRMLNRLVNSIKSGSTKDEVDIGSIGGNIRTRIYLKVI